MQVQNFKENANIFLNDDEEQIAYLGSVFHNKKSRDMWILLSNNPDKEYYLKEMAVIIEGHKNPRLPIYEHHIKALVKSRVVYTTEKLHNKHKTIFYRSAPIVIVTTPKYYKNITKNTF